MFLDLDSNLLSRGIANNSVLIILKLAHNRFSDLSAQRFGAALADNRTLQVTRHTNPSGREKK